MRRQDIVKKLENNLKNVLIFISNYFVSVKVLGSYHNLKLPQKATISYVSVTILNLLFHKY